MEMSNKRGKIPAGFLNSAGDNRSFEPDASESVQRPEAAGDGKNNVDVRVLSELKTLRSWLLSSVRPESYNSKSSLPEVGSREILRSVEDEIGRLRNNLNSLLPDGSHTEDPVRPLKSGVRVYQIINSIMDGLKYLTLHHPLRIIISDGLPEVYADPDLIGKVLLTIVRYSVRLSKEGSPVIIETESGSDHVVIHVTDNGVGFPSRLWNHIFEPCCGMDYLVMGVGLGKDNSLALCGRIVEAHGSKIRVESKVGQGSRFSFKLPLNRQEQDSQAGQMKVSKGGREDG